MSLRPFLVLLALTTLACPPAPTRRFRSDTVMKQTTVGLPGANAPVPERVRMHVIDVGQGSATLFEFPCAAVLIDTGGESTEHFDAVKSLTTYLDRFFERRTDLNRTLTTVFITHPHIDHTRGLPAVLERYTVKHLVTNGQPRGIDGAVLESGGETQENAEALFKKKNAWTAVARAQIEPGQGFVDGNIDAVQCEGLDPEFKVYWGGLKQNLEGWEPKAFANANNHSVVVHVTVGGHSILVTGDLETEAILSLLNAHGAVLNSDVLIVGHHGSHNGTTMGLVQTVTPCMAVMSMGDSSRQEDWTAWAYGHPRKVAVQLLTQGLGCSRTPKEVPVALGQRRFEPFMLSTALYGTGWEGSVVLEQSARGTWKAVTER
ncbi:MAG: MBL fold metallo-hydrolase [Myxococcaceae bacterium]